jgi:hypothetical protein
MYGTRVRWMKKYRKHERSILMKHYKITSLLIITPSSIYIQNISIKFRNKKNLKIHIVESLNHCEL